MKAEDKKLEIIEWLVNVEDFDLLQQIDFIRKSDEERWSDLNDEERKAIEKGIRELDEGKGIPHEDVVRDLREKYTS